LVLTLLSAPIKMLDASMIPTTPTKRTMSPTPPPKILPSLVLLDRDGVINVDVGSPGVTHPSQLCLTPGASSAIGSLKRAGCNVALVTNQSCVGKKLITYSELQVIHETIFNMLHEEDKDAKIDTVYCCTSTKECGDERMKPSPGMIREAKRDFGVEGDQCIFVGDTLTDMQAAKGGGVESRILVSTGYGVTIMGGNEAPEGGKFIENPEDSSIPLPSSALPFLYFKNLATAVSWLLCENED